MKINYENSTIEMTKTESKSAGIYGSNCYKELMEIRADFPTYQVIVKERSTRNAKNKKGYKGLTFQYMETYIINHSKNDKSVLMEFYKRTARSDKTQDAYPQSESYFKIVAWFFEVYPDIKNYYEIAKN